MERVNIMPEIFTPIYADFLFVYIRLISIIRVLFASDKIIIVWRKTSNLPARKLRGPSIEAVPVWKRLCGK